MRSSHRQHRSFLKSCLRTAVSAAALALAASAQAQQAAPQHDFEALKKADSFWGYFNEYCTECHNADDFSGGIDFTDKMPGDVTKTPELFEKVLVKMRGRMMPPPNKIRPDEKKTDAFIGWMESYLDEAGKGHENPSHVAIHRLNRKEYANAIRDLFGIKVEAKEMLPQDSSSDGFDNVAEALTVSPAFIEQYLASARNISEQVVGDPIATLGSKVYMPGQDLPVRAEGGGFQQFHVDGLPLGTRGGMLVNHWFPADGEYAVNVGDFNLFAWMYNVEFENKLIVTVDGDKVYETVVGGDKDRIGLDLDQGKPLDDMNGRTKNIRFKVTAGPHKIGVAYVRRSFAESDDQLQHQIPGSVQDRILPVPSVEIRGPFSVTGVTPNPAREALYTCQPKDKAQETACGREIIAKVATRAYRRALTDADMQPIMQFFESGRADGGFDEGIRRGLTRILTSPNFLYRAEAAPANARPGEIYQLNSIDLASRLSFFLWSSIPDDRLLQLAVEDKLKDPAVLKAEVKRMLADEKAKALAENFAYQWLHLSKLDEIIPDTATFPYASGAGDLRPDFKQELNLFVDSVFRSDQSIMRLLDADYSFINERLALHYGIKDIKGDRFRRVQLADSNRWGLLGKGAILMVTAYPNRTSPVLRGAWILENIMGAPPPTPPANVPALEETEKGKVATTVRERLEQHRKNPVCFSCHSVMDPLGFALDNFDAVGRWRDRDRFAATAVDASGLMPNGKTVVGPTQLRAELLARPNNFVQGIAGKLMIYALGRTLDARDMPQVREVVRNTAAQDFKFEAMVSSIIHSPLFQKNTVPVAKIASVASNASN